MIALACLTVVAIAVLAYAYAQQRTHEKQQTAWAAERRELLNRIQHPELVTILPDTKPFTLPDQQPDGWARAGQIESIDDDYGMTDDDG